MILIGPQAFLYSFSRADMLLRAMPEPANSQTVERLFPFVLRARILIPGRDNILRSRSNLHFILISTDLSAGSRAEILKNFAPYPIVERYTAEEIETHFKLKNALVLGFAKSGLAQSIYAELKEFRVNKPPIQAGSDRQDKP
jgi:hypothetical protein